MAMKPDWKTTEEIAALLEKALEPSARVEHNVRLPVVGRSRSRQCDVVITYGKPPRETIAIVEVQKRKRKPEITIFHGWVQKMREVGAQHLICVSALGYPQSIIDEVATQLGPTVRLLTLEELSTPSIGGLNFVQPFLIHRKPVFSFEEIENTSLETELANNEKIRLLTARIFPNDAVFSLDDSDDRHSLVELVTELVGEVAKLRSEYYLAHNWPESDSYRIDAELGSVTQDLWLHQGETKVKIYRMPIHIRVDHVITEIPTAFHAYRQEAIDGALAWIASAQGTVEGGEEIFVQIVFKPDSDGFLRLATVGYRGATELRLSLFSGENAAKQSAMMVQRT